MTGATIPCGPRSRLVLRWLLLIGCAATLADEPSEGPRIGWTIENGFLRLLIPQDPQNYYILEHTASLDEADPIAMNLGFWGPVWVKDIPMAADAEFFPLLAVPAFAPRDTDGDGIDDVYELLHSKDRKLDSLNRADVLLDPDSDGITNLEEYRRKFGYGVGPPEVFSREVSLWNFGAPTAHLEAFSVELSVYNASPGSGPPPSDAHEMFSREVSVFNLGSLPDGRLEAISRETSVYNFGSPPARLEAISRELSLYNAGPGSGPPATDLAEATSREVSVFNFGEPTARLEAISREASILNYQEPINP
jgi:hypothetical protein